jgi:hypothetical protein
MKRKTYYYVIEKCLEDNCHHGYYMTLEKAQKKSDELQDIFGALDFYVYHSDTRREPVFLTMTIDNRFL